MMKAATDKTEDHFEGRFDDIVFTKLKDAMERQKTADGQLKLKGRPDKIIDDPFNGEKKYIIAFADQKKGQDEKRVFLYMKGENEISRFKNMILTNSDIGMKMLKRSDTVRFREELINVWKVRQAEEFYRLMNSLTDWSPDHRVTLRKMAIKKAVKDELGKIGPDPLVKVPEANPKWLKGFEKTERFCEHQRKKNIKWSYNKLAKLQPQRKPLELVFTPRKLYLLGAEESAPGKNDNSTTDDLFIGIWPKRITNTEIPVKGLDNSRKLELSRIPKTTRIFATEYSTMSTPWEIDCNRNKGQYLYAYTRNGVTNKITSAGCVEISDRLPLVFTIDMVDENTRTNNNRPVINSKLAVRRERIEVPLPNDEMFRNLFQAGNFGFMNRYNNARKKDAGVGDVSNVEGYGAKYEKTFQILGGDFSTSEAIAFQESEVYRWTEWRYFEDIVAEANKQASKGFDYERYSKENPVAPVHDKNSFLFQLGRFTMEEPENVDFNEKSFLFFDRHKWVNDKNYRDANLRYEKAMITGMPTYLYLPVWKSLGKTALLKFFVEKVVRECTKLSGTWDKWINVYSTLQVAGREELSKHPELLSELDRLVPRDEYPADYVDSLKGILQAYLQLSLFMEDASLAPERPMLIQGFSLKNVGGLLPIMKNLLDLYYITAKNKDKDPRCASVTEEDPFYVLLSFAFIFLPDHFLMPILTFELTDGLITHYESMKSFGLKFAHQIKNKMFINVGSNGSFKLSVILAMCIKKDTPDVYKKMTDLGFPFLTFCLEMSETLFTKTLNADTLYKLWNLIFFEGGNTVKRRAQQIVLSAILSRVHFCKKLILESRSANEIYWHLKADGFLNHDSSEFIAEIFTIRRNHFVTKETGLIDNIKSVFVSDESVEKSYKKIKKEILTDFEHIALSNYTYLNWVNSTLQDKSSQGGPYNIQTLKVFLQKWQVASTGAAKPLTFSVYDPLSEDGVVVLTKPTPNSITFGICYSHYGNMSPEDTTIEFSASYTDTSKLLKFTDPDWYNTFEGNPSPATDYSNHWLEIKIESSTRNKERRVKTVRVSLASLGLNRDNFVKLALEDLSLSVNVRLRSADLKTNSKDYFTKLDHDLQHLAPPFVDLFADQMGIKKETPYKDEILNSYANAATVRAMLGYAFAGKQLEYSKDFETLLLKKDLFGEGNPNIFEVFARFILFSPFSQHSTLRYLFILLNSLDVNNGGAFVKKSHVEFLVWYIYRIGLIYMPYSEIITQCSTILNGSDCSIQSGVITFEDDPKRSPVDITEILNVWLVATRRRTATSTLVLGENGQLTNLKNAISFWNSQNSKSKFKPSNKNKLLIWLNSKGKTEHVQFEFNSDFKLLANNITKNSKVVTKHVVCVKNTEELLEFGQFEHILCQIDVLDWILSRLSSIGSDITRVNEIQQEMLRMTTNSQFMDFTAKASFIQERAETGRVNFVGKHINSIKPPMEDVNKLDAVLDIPSSIGFGKEIPSLIDVEYLTNDVTIREIFKEAQEIVVNKMAAKVSTGSPQYTYRQDCLSVFKLTFEDLSQVIVNGSILKPEYYDMSLKKISYIFKNVAAFEIAFHYNKSSVPRTFNHLARYPHKQETPVEFDNPFTPCQILIRHPQFSEVIFSGETVSSYIPNKDIVTKRH